MLIRSLVLLALAIGLSACGGLGPAARNLPDPGLAEVSVGSMDTRAEGLMPQYRVTAVRVAVPRSLRVSEANRFYPWADIVWRGEPAGDRYAQVSAILLDGLVQGTAGMMAGPEIVIEAKVTRFHSLTEKTRYTVGGVHSIRFSMTVRDAVTGQVIDGPRKVVADVKAAGGARAMVEDRIGRTQRVVIVEAIARAIQRELSARVPQPGAEPAARAATDLLGPVLR